ncbi:MAG: type II toxin-antitoxin system HipA family toxin [Bacteroidales bacterium]|nr:type II toxin-antitoxin system HipA family toxin [Bacteroidales bacterium]MBD5342919.1 type II toxin-antitoxin system HipA family toxin [Bacteroides sp.]MBD5361147.1 type II toxin-antitoxin system HipA family toxin [Bacteroides sp.]MBD5362117.1 type II toxin-antitoxin system HipA family toxin [Bacteroides sp.]MBD5364587.1 type II toxin-antitoxin system HipA family toxin [Bacteroides sp.]
MVDIAKVNLYGRQMGSVRWDSNRNVSLFEYADNFMGEGLEPSPLLMPVRHGRVYSFGDIGRETFKGLPGMLADSLPDTYGRALFERWLALTGRQSGNVVETLCFLGKRCMGALEFEPAMDRAYGDDVKIELDSLVEVASEALAEKEDFGANLTADKKAAIAEIVRLGTSAGGQRAKAIIAYNKETGEVRSGQVDAPVGFDYYLIKLDGVTAEAGFRETQNFGRLEYSFFRLVRECGIEMSECNLIEENGRAHFLTKRFDRVNGEKIHMQTLCGIAHYDYRMPRSYSYEQAFNVMRALRLPYSQAQEMFRRMVFNVIVRNQDDHTKNISFLMDKTGRWSLSPAYDMGFAYNPKGGWTSQHQMSINGKFDEITRQDLLEFASRNNIKDAAEIIDNIKESASRWPLIAKECEVPRQMIDAILPEMKLSL